MVISVVSLIGFIVREFTAEHPLVDLRVFKNRNFAVGVILMTVAGRDSLRHDGGIAAVFADADGLSGVAKRLRDESRAASRRSSPRSSSGAWWGASGCRWLLCFGFTMLAVSSFMLSDITLQVSQMRVIWPSIVNGIAISFIFVPLTTTTMSQLRQQQIGNATGIYNLMRNLGGSIGIAFVTTMLARGAQAHQALMVGHLTPTDPVFRQRLAAAQALLARHGDPVTATSQAYSLIYSTLDHQAHLWAFVDNFRLFGLLALGGIPLIFLFKRIKRVPARAMEVH